MNNPLGYNYLPSDDLVERIISKSKVTHHTGTSDKIIDKKTKAITIYKEMTNAGRQRKYIIIEFKEQLKMTHSCSSTYYQNIKSGRWPID